MTYFEQTDLENALSAHLVEAAYDDDGDGEVDAAPMAACIAYGTAMCNSFLRNVMTSGGSAIELPLVDVPDEVKFAAIDFGIYFTVRRRPELLRAITGEDPHKYRDSAIEQMRRYCASEQRMPATVGTPATAGGALLNPDSDEEGVAEDLPNESRWADMGLFS